MSNTRNISSYKQPRLVFGIIIVLLGGLLYSKISGHQEIFSYRSIDATTPGYTLYQSAIQTINKTLVGGTGSSTFILQQSINKLQDTIKMVRSRSLLTLSSGSLLQAQSLLTLSKANDCYDLLIDGYHHIQLIRTGFDLLTSGYTSIKGSLQSVLGVLPASTTKDCLQNYMDSLSKVYNSLLLTNRTINNLDSSYSTVLSTYQGIQGDCNGLKNLINSLSGLQYRIDSINTIIQSVQKSLDSKEIAQYKNFCKYQGIIGLSGLQKISWESLAQSSSLGSSLSKVNDLKQYIQQLIDTSKTVSGDAKENWFTKRWK